MCAMPLSADNDPLMLLVDYSDLKILKKLTANLSNLGELAKAGDRTAMSIYIDLKNAIDCTGLTELQRTCVKQHLVEKNTLKQVAEMLDRSESTVAHSVTGGLKNMRKFLEG